MPRVQECLLRFRLRDVSRLAKPKLRDCDRGSATVEAVIGVPVFLLLLGLLIVGGRVAISSPISNRNAGTPITASTVAEPLSQSGRCGFTSLVTSDRRIRTRNS